MRINRDPTELDCTPAQAKMVFAYQQSKKPPEQITQIQIDSAIRLSAQGEYTLATCETLRVMLPMPTINRKQAEISALGGITLPSTAPGPINDLQEAVTDQGMSCSPFMLAAYGVEVIQVNYDLDYAKAFILATGIRRSDLLLYAHGGHKNLVALGAVSEKLMPGLQAARDLLVEKMAAIAEQVRDAAKRLSSN